MSLPLKEQQAIELKYQGVPYTEIAEKIDIKIDTISGWFEKSGKLFRAYEKYESNLNDIRRKKALEQFIESDENIIKITTNMMRQVGNSMHSQTFIQADENGQPVLKDGKPVMIKVPAIGMGIKDYKTAWEIQRVMRGLPTDVKSQNLNFNQEEIDKEAEAIRDILDGSEKDNE